MNFPRDLYQYIIDERSDSFNFITRAAKATDGELLYPSRLTIGFLEKQRKGQGSYIFSCQYMNNPVDEETAKFKREWFKYKTWLTSTACQSTGICSSTHHLRATLPITQPS